LKWLKKDDFKENHTLKIQIWWDFSPFRLNLNKGRS